MNPIKPISTLLFLFTLIAVSQTKIDTLINSLEHTQNKEIRLKVLDTLTKKMVRSNHENQISYLKDYISLALELKEYDLAASKSRFLVYQLNGHLKYDESFALIDSMLSYKSQFKKINSEAHLLLKKGGVHFALTEFNKAIDNYQTSLPLFYKSGDSIFAADALYFSGQAYFLSGNFSNAIQSLDKAQGLYEILGDTEYSNLTALETINLLNTNGLKEIGRKRFKELLFAAKEAKNYCLVSIIYLNIISGDIENNNKLTYSFEAIKKYIDKCNNPRAVLRSNYYSKIYQIKVAVNNKERKLASNYYKELMEIEALLKDPYEISYSALAKVMYFNSINKKDKSLVVLKEYFDFTKNVPINSLRVDIEKVASDVYADVGNIRKSKEHLDTYVKFKDSLYNSATANSYSYYQTQFETSKKEKEIVKQHAAIKLLEQEKEVVKSKNNMLYAIFSALLILIFSLTYYFYEKARRKRRHIIKQLERSKTELQKFTKRLLSKSAEQEVIKKELEHLKTLYGEKEDLNDLEELADSKILTNDDWSNFKDKFINVYPQFFINLKIKGYKFTNAEERLITLEKLDLKVSDIANMLAISPESVHTSRYRLRKKIMVPKEFTIINYLEA